ncbi:hypothetical protein Lesp02_37060 [Lentzea sp. NBRC 105346]|uniref:hypothetical protein n=1 Tax=Lentzea sp. NBRC 105346 TaxID=3032205 RepID=UPI0024A02786|nr:hypothetical protein [Lentzea sp. NBRC 105346]GLZ31518.1 hypothetical protein Lesp02_37060 [Lentzea sp. NBRC 105346]
MTVIDSPSQLCARIGSLAPRRVLHIGDARLAVAAEHYRLVSASERVHARRGDYDLVLLDLTARGASTLDIPATVTAGLGLVGHEGAVFVANLGAAGWSPSALLRGLGPGVEVHAYPDFDVVLRHSQRVAGAPMLRWNHELHAASHLARLLADRSVERVRLVGVPLACWHEIDAICAEHGYEVASSTGTQYHFDAVLELR